MTSNFNVTVAVNNDSGTVDVPPFGFFPLRSSEALDAVLRRTGPPWEVAE